VNVSVLRRTRFGLGAWLVALTLPGATLTVTNADDSGAGSLRQAILDSNASVGIFDTIAFDIPGEGVHTIESLSPFPVITDPVTIDGYTQPGASPNTLAVGNDAVLLVELYPIVGTLQVHTDATTIRGLILGGSLYLEGDGTNGGHIVRGNFIGTDPTGTLSRGNLGNGVLSTSPGVTIGGPNPADRNIISGTQGVFAANLYLSTNEPGGIAGTLVQGNYIGLDASGATIVGTPTSNILVFGEGVTIGGVEPGEGNVISGAGISVSGGATLRGNLIGTDAAGTLSLGAWSRAISVSGDGNVIGGIDAGAGNVIAFAADDAILVLSGTGNTIRGNSIFSNGELGINLSPGGTNPNDPGDGDSGANNLQNFPVLTAVTFEASTTTVEGFLDSSPNTLFDLDIYANPPCAPRPRDPLQARNYVGSGTVTTDGSGIGSFSLVLPVALDPTQILNATATDPGGNTSELSQRLVLGIVPRSGPAAGGTSVTASGTRFVAGATVQIGGEGATSVVVSSESELTAETPALAPGSINAMVVDNPDGTVGDLPFAWLADFSDVPADHVFHAFVESLVLNGVAAGCGGGNYCVDTAVTRAQMAVFLLKGKHGLCFVPPAATGAVFADVAPGDFFADWIEALAAEGITGGCGGGNYCPQSPVRRDQMAVFLLKAMHGSTYLPPPCGGAFGDVACPSTFADWIERLAVEQITGGCGGGNYCPLNLNTRGQMAVFIVKAFALE